MNTRYLTAAAAAAALALGPAAVAAGAAPSSDSLGPPPPGCEVDLDALAAETPPPDFPGWQVTDSSDLCGNLGFAVLDTAGGTGSSPTAVVLMHRGEPVPTQPGGEQPAQVLDASDFHVIVETRGAPDPDDANAEAPTTATMYLWNPFDSDVVPIRLPD